MPHFEYKVIPAPKRPLRVGGALSRQPGYVDSLAAMMNDLGSDGWEYVRTDSISYRQGRLAPLRRLQVMVFRREDDGMDVEDSVPPLAWVMSGRPRSDGPKAIRRNAIA